jgi:hypothetical protein
MTRASKRLARQGSAVASAAGDEGHSFGADLLGVHAPGRHHEALTCPESLGRIVSGYGDLAAEYQRLGVEVVAVLSNALIGDLAVDDTRYATIATCRRRFPLLSAGRSCIVLQGTEPAPMVLPPFGLFPGHE